MKKYIDTGNYEDFKTLFSKGLEDSVSIDEFKSLFTDK